MLVRVTNWVQSGACDPPKHIGLTRARESGTVKCIDKRLVARFVEVCLRYFLSGVEHAEELLGPPRQANKESTTKKVPS